MASNVFVVTLLAGWLAFLIAIILLILGVRDNAAARFAIAALLWAVSWLALFRGFVRVRIIRKDDDR